MVKYSEAKIYKVHSKSYNGLCYVGSTTKKYLSQRISTHKISYLKWKNDGKGYEAIFELYERFGCDGLNIELIENYPCSSKNELDKKVYEHIQALDCVNKLSKNYTEDIIEDVVEEEEPTIEYLINLRKEYMMYQHRYQHIDKVLRWNENNLNVDMDLHRHIWNNLLTYLLVDLRDAKLPDK